MSQASFILPRPILLVLAALGLLFAIDLFALAAYRDLRLATEELKQRHETMEALRPLPVMMLEMQSGVRGYLLTGSQARLNRYRTAANAFPEAARRALAMIEDPRQFQLVESAAASAQDWLNRFASPLVVKRSAGEGRERSLAAALELLHKGRGDIVADRMRSLIGQSMQIQREHIERAQLNLQRQLDRTSAWMRGRAAALLLALAALTLMLGRTLAKLTGQTHSREIAESAVRTSSATLRAMRDASPLGMFLADSSGACMQSNPAFQRITGLSESAVMGNGWQAALHADDRQRVMAAWNDAIAASASFSSEHRFVHRSGKVVWASMKTATMRDGGRLIGFACSIEDVSERREAEDALRKSEERLHLALENSRLALFDWHLPSGEIVLSREWNVLTGHGSQAGTTTARRLNEQIHPEDRDGMRESVMDALKTNKPIVRTQFRIETRSGQWKRICCTGRVTERDAVGRAVRLTGTVSAAD
jgi:PAS domain S-box-containing protein